MNTHPQNEMPLYLITIQYTTEELELVLDRAFGVAQNKHDHELTMATLARMTKALQRAKRCEREAKTFGIDPNRSRS